MDRHGLALSSVTSPTGQISFLFTDVEGSTRLWETYPDQMRRALEIHDGIARAAIEANDGYVFTTAGDAFAVAFHRPGDALAAGIAIHQNLAAHPWGDEVVIRVRMGLHVGEATERDGDYFGPTLNRTARVESSAHGGQFVISDLARTLCEADGVIDGLIDLGEHRLKDLGSPERIWQVPVPGVPGDHPPLRTLSRHLTNLPNQLTEFVGRDHDRRSVADALESGRLVTIRGLGGMGKTRLALQVGADVFPHFDDGVWLVELAPAREPSAVPFALASALGYSSLGQTPLEAAVSGIGDRRMLVILDNCEHVVETVGDLVNALLTRCPNVRILATSRLALSTPGERMYNLDPLAGDADDGAAVELFLARAQAANPDLQFDAARLAVVTELVRQLDGVPLAIELAAARVRSLTPEELLDRLGERFRLLRAKGGAVPRHQRLVDAIEWSYSHLDPDEQLLFRRLSVFAGAFSLAAAEAVCSDDLLDEFDVLDLIEGLVDQSMVIPDMSGPVTCYRLLESLREFGSDLLGIDDKLLDHHGEYFAAAVAVTGAGTVRVEEAQARIEVDMIWDDVRAAWYRARELGDAAKACTLSGHLTLELLWRSRLEPSEWARATIEMDGFDQQSPMDRIGVLGVAASGMMHGVENELAVQYVQQAMELVEQVPVAELDHRIVHNTSVMFFTGQLTEGVRIIDGLIERIEEQDGMELLADLIRISQASMYGYLGEGDLANNAASSALRSSGVWGPSWQALAEWDIARYGDNVDTASLTALLPELILTFRSIPNEFLASSAERHLYGLRAQRAELSEHMAVTASKLATLDIADPRVPTGWLLTAAVALLKAERWFEAGVLLEWQERFRAAPILPDRQVQLDELVPQMEAAVDDGMRRRMGETLDVMDLAATVRYAIDALHAARMTLVDTGPLEAAT